MNRRSRCKVCGHLTGWFHCAAWLMPDSTLKSWGPNPWGCHDPGNHSLLIGLWEAVSSKVDWKLVENGFDNWWFVGFPATVQYFLADCRWSFWLIRTNDRPEIDGGQSRWSYPVPTDDRESTSKVTTKKFGAKHPKPIFVDSEIEKWVYHNKSGNQSWLLGENNNHDAPHSRVGGIRDIHHDNPVIGLFRFYKLLDIAQSSMRCNILSEFCQGNVS